jgi:hypothetical protein
MSTTVPYQELKAYLQTAFQPTPVLDFDSIDPQLEQSNNPFLCIEEIVGFEDLISIGDPSALCFREEVDFLVHAFVPSPESSALARQLAEQVMVSLRLRNLGATRVSKLEPPEPEDANDGLWTVYGITVSLINDFRFAAP